MENTTSEWFQSLDHRTRKRLIGILHIIRSDIEKNLAKGSDHELVLDLIRHLDDEHHEMKDRESHIPEKP